MNHFSYSGGEYRAEEVALSRIAEAVGTPFYCYSSATMVRHYRMLAEALEGVPARIFYALKANSNLAVIRTLAAQGAGADVVSEGEIRRALAAGVTPDSIVFSGVGKTAEEMAFAIEAGILQFNIESEPELDLLAEVAGARNTTVEIAVRINPDVDAHSHDKISTGRRGDKFGIAWPGARETYARAAAMPAINVAGVAVHIGSQILDLAPFEAAFGIAAQAVETLRGDGHAIRRLDLGGGLGVPYGGELPPPPSAYGDLVRRTCAGLGCDIMLEPGRLLVANAGVLVTRVLFVKESAERTFYNAVDKVAERTGQDGIDQFQKALDAIKPVVEVRSRRVGGSTYQIPVEVRPERRLALAIRWLIQYSSERSERTMADRLASEIFQAANNEGAAIRRKEDTHRMAEANRAFSHYRLT